MFADQTDGTWPALQKVIFNIRPSDNAACKAIQVTGAPSASAHQVHGDAPGQGAQGETRPSRRQRANRRRQNGNQGGKGQQQGSKGKGQQQAGGHQGGQQNKGGQGQGKSQGQGTQASQSSQNQGGLKKAAAGKDDKCFGCGRTGHWRRDCPDQAKSAGAGSGQVGKP
eukprot:10798398-Prorocentrum_lima.AAC.1